MQILVLTPFAPVPQSMSGGARVMHGLVSGLAERHSVSLVTFVSGLSGEHDGLARLEELGVHVYAVQREEPRGLGRWRRRAVLAARWQTMSWPLRALEFRDSRFQQALDHLFARRSFDVLQVEDNAMAGYRFPREVPAVLTEHEVRAPRPPRLSPRGAVADLQRKRWMTYQAAAWRKFDRVQVFTATDLATLSRIAPQVAGRARVNPFGVDIPAHASTEAGDSRSLVFVGAFAHEPNVDAALWLAKEIMPLVRARIPAARLTIVGKDPPPRVRALQDAQTSVEGDVPSIEPYLDEAAVVVAPLRQGAGMRVKVLEAMARGKAVVTTPLGAEGLEVCGSSVPVRVAHSTEAFAREIVRLLEDADARRSLGAEARRLAGMHFTWAAHIDRLEVMYADIVESPVAAA